MRHVFISYIRENSSEVQRLCSGLTQHGVEVWLDRNDIAVGARWKQAIRRAIREGAFFVACFSKQYNEREKTFMNEELTIAMEELRQRPTDKTWFIPIKLSECEIPDRDIGAGETLQDLQYVELYKGWEDGIRRIVEVTLPQVPAEKTPQRNIKELQEILGSASPYYDLSSQISPSMVEIKVTEKYPGASRDHPITLSGKLILPDSPRGRKVRGDLEALHKWGTPVEIRKPYITGFEPPDFITRITGPPGELSMLRLQPKASKEPLPVRIDIVPSEGGPYSLECVELIRQRVGTEEVLLTSEGQNIPIKIRLTLNIAAKTARIDFQCSFENLNVKQVLDCLRLQDVLSKDGTIFISKTVDGLELLKLPITEGQIAPPSEDWIGLLEDLVFIQTRTHCQVWFPSRKIAAEDLNTVAKVKRILTTGQTEGTWDSFTVSLYKKGVENLLNRIENTSDQAIPLVLEIQETERVLGTEIPLGPVRICMEQAILENEMEELRRFSRTTSEKDSLQLRFRPHGSNHVVMSYVNWQV